MFQSLIWKRIALCLEAAALLRCAVRVRNRVVEAACVVVSAALHAMLALMLLAEASGSRAADSGEQRMWMEAVVPPPTIAASDAPEVPQPPQPHTPERAAQTQRGEEGPPRADTAEGEVAFEAASAPAGGGKGTSGGELVSASEGGGNARAPIEEETRELNAAQLSIWLAPQRLKSAALPRPTLALLAALPGYREALGDADVDPLDDLRRLHISVPGRAMQRLVIAGLHARGEAAVLEMAARTAAARKRGLTWHGDGDLRATSWLDGSGVDRVLAAHQGAFVIGARSTLLALLERAGTLSAERVAGASQLDESAILHVTIDDASRYLPALRECAVRALSVSVARTRGEGMRVVLTAQYEAASAAARAGNCSHSSALERATPRLHEWLKRAQPLAGSYTTQLRAEVTRAELQQLLEELARIAHGG